MSERYEIKGKLARGGIGAIYLAHDNSLDREVAIKRLLPLEETKLNEAADESLSREASALAKFTHPNVVTIYSFEEDEEGPFVVTELIDGENLKETTERGALAMEDFNNLVDQTLDPMITAREMNLLHRDIKPANIMVTILASGKFQIKILDFGLAKFSQTPSTQTLDQQGSFLGSIEYLAPEQLELRPLDQRTDLYSLGCVYYYTLTQISPFEGENAAETMDNHLEHRVTDIREHRDDISDELACWLMRLINRQPDDRPDDARMAMAEYVAAKRGEMPPGGNHSILPGPAVTAAPISEAVTPMTDAAPVGVDTASQAISMHTGPMGETTGQRLLKQKQAEQEAAKSKNQMKLPLIGLASVLIVAAAIFLLMSSGDDPQPSEPAVATEDTPAPTAPVEPNTAGMPALAKVDNSGPENLGFQPLPAIDPGATNRVAPPIRENLAAHFYAGLGTFQRDTVSASEIGSLTHAWANLAPDSQPLNYLSRAKDDLEGESAPRQISVGPDRFPGLNGIHPALHFPTNATMMTRNGKAREDLSGNSVHAFFVAAVSSEPYLAVLRLTEYQDYGRGAILSGFEGNLRVARRNGLDEFGNAIKEVGNSMAVVSYSMNLETGRQTFRVTTPDGESVEESRSDLPIEPIELANYLIGDSNAKEENRSEFTMCELLLYNRALDDDEAFQVERSLFDRYFGESEAPPTITTAPGAFPVTRNLLARYDASVGTFADDATTPVETGATVINWQNLVPESVAPMMRANPEIAEPPTLALAEPTPVSDAFPVLRFAKGSVLNIPRSAAIDAFTDNQVTMLLLSKAVEMETGLIARFDGTDVYSLVSFFRTAEGASVMAVNKKTKDSFFRKAELKTRNWLFWSLSYDGTESRLITDLSYAGGGWRVITDETTPGLGADITRYQLGIPMRTGNEQGTTFDVAQMAIYNTVLTREEKEAVFAHWRERYFKAE